MSEDWTVERAAADPLVATSIHAGHAVRPGLDGLLAISESDRLREEDPFTDRWTTAAQNRVVVHTSRFEVDLNRPPERAVYRQPDDAWGLTVWKSELSSADIERSRAIYNRFYEELGVLCDSLVAQHGRFVLLDLHSYNHRRAGADRQVADPSANPEINVGTGSVDAQQWGSTVRTLMDALAHHPFEGGHLDVRENVKFTGGHMSQWLNQRYGVKGCALAIEVKKIYMDEWTGEPDESAIVSLGEVLAGAADAVRGTLGDAGPG